MKNLVLLVLSTFLISNDILSQCPSTANCGCSNKLKAICPSDPCCQWIVGTGCKCKSQPSIIDNLNIDSVEIYPNPTNDILKLKFYVSSSKPITFEIVSLDGKTIYYQKINEIQSGYNCKSVNVSLITKGAYICRLNNGDKLNIIKLLKK